MFFKKKKKVVIEGNKYNIGNFINFRYKGEIKVGSIAKIYQDEEKNISYDINVGGECPYIVRIDEKNIIGLFK